MNTYFHNVENFIEFIFDTNFNYALNLDKRNSAYQPSAGFRSLFRQELPLVADDKTIKNSYEFNAHHEFVEDMVGSLSFFTAAVSSLSDEDVRISKRLFIPGRKLRGFEVGKVGPKDGLEYVGGNYLTTINLSSSLPKVLATQENVDFRVFFDAANVWHVDYSDSINNSNGEIVIDLDQDPFHVKVRISDDGCGIPKKDWKNIFRPGFSTKKSGWGLGLSLCQRIIKEVHKGKIYVLDSKINKGTVIELTIPNK